MSGNDIVPQCGPAHNGGQPYPKNNNRITALFTVQSLLWLALLLALAGSLKHLAAIFASVDGNIFMGWLQAVAIDAGLFALAYSIRQRKTAERSTLPLWFGVVLFSGISIYGNLAYGLLATSGTLPAWILTSRPYILAASLPVLVIFLSELLADDRQFLAAQAAKAAKKLAKQAPLATGNTPYLAPANATLASINEQKAITKQARLTQLAALLQDTPQAGNSQLATMLEVSRATIRNYRKELNGQVK